MIHKLEFRAMGCQMLAALETPTERGAERLASVPGWFEAWEQSLSRFRPDSELSQLNRNSGSAQPVSLELWKVFQAARQAEQRSSGLVSPVLLDALESAGYVSSFETLGAGVYHAVSPVLEKTLPATGFLMSHIECDERRRNLCLPHGARLDFGGVAKGWAAHQAMSRLKGYGPALVDAGGDIALSAPQRDGLPWAIGVADPTQQGEDIALLMLGKGGVATSGRDYRRWQKDGRWQHHLIDPRSGLPAETDVLSVTVVAPNVMEAETAAKTVLILGSQAGLDWLENQPGLAGILLLEDGRRLDSKRMKAYLWS
jgi:thiamine biosynthesis lipoprotein